MIAHVPGYLCAADVAKLLGLTDQQVWRLAYRRRWRKKARPGHREVYYNAEDVIATPERQRCLTNGP